MWTALSSSLGVSHLRTMAYHLQSNGLVKWFQQSLKSALRARLTTLDWINESPWTLLGLRCALKLDFGVSSAKLTLWRSPLLPGAFFIRHLAFLGLLTAALYHSPCPGSTLPRLDTVGFIFVHDDTQPGPLKPPIAVLTEFSPATPISSSSASATASTTSPLIV